MLCLLDDQLELVRGFEECEESGCCLGGGQELVDEERGRGGVGE